MASPRRKTPALEAPQTIESATALLGRYAELLTGCEQIRADADVSIAAIQAARDALVKPLEEECKDIFRQLSRWWAVAGVAMTEGKRKSVDIAGCTIGIRTATPSLKLPKGSKEDDIVTWLRDLADSGYLWASTLLRVKYNLEKPELIKVLRLSSPSTAGKFLIDKGMSVAQPDQFFIDRAKSEPAPADPEMQIEEALG